MGKGNEHKRQTPIDQTTERACGVGLGLTIAATITLFYRSAPLALTMGLQSVKPLVIGIGVGVLAVGIAFSLYCLRDSFSPERRTTTSRLMWLGAICMALGALAFATHTDIRITIGSMPLDCSGIVIGVGMTFAFFAWQRRFATLTESSFFPATVYALAAAGLACGIIAAAPFAVGIGASCVAMLGGALLCVTQNPNVPASGADAVKENKADSETTTKPAVSAGGREKAEAPAARRMRRLVTLAWKPLLGTAICAFVIGFTWDTDLIGVPLNNTTMLASEKVIGFLIAAILLFALSRTQPHDRIESVLLYTILPLALFSFIVRPYFLGSDLPTAVLMVIGVARELGFVLFFTASWLELCTAPRKAEASTGLLFGIACVMCGGVLLLGFGGTYIFGPAINTMGAILFIVYLIAIVASSTIDARSNSKPLSAQDVEGFLETRAEAIGDEYNLTPREREIVLHLSRGHSYASIAERLFISENTLRTHARNIYRKMGVSSREGLINLIHPDVK